MNKKKWLIIGVAVVGIAVAGLVIVPKIMAPKVTTDAEVTYTISAQTLTKNLYADGIVKINHESQIFSELNGALKTVFFDIGDEVKAGDILMTLDTSKLMQSLQQAKYQLMVDQDALNDLKNSGTMALGASYDKASAAYDRAKKTYADNQILFEQGAISETDLNQSKASVDSTYSEFLAAKDKKETTSLQSEINKLQTKIKLDQLTIANIETSGDSVNIVAPIAGTITVIQSEMGKTFNAGEKLVTISDLKQLSVTSMISEYDIPQVKIGQTVKITTLGSADKVYNGLVAAIAPVGTVSGSEVLVEVTVNILDPDALLKPNFTTNLEILIDQKENAMAVPFDALVAGQDNKQFVLKKTEKGIERVLVTKGIETDLYIQVLSDQLKSGDLLVLPSTSTSGNNSEMFRLPGRGQGVGMPDSPINADVKPN